MAEREIAVVERGEQPLSLRVECRLESLDAARYPDLPKFLTPFSYTLNIPMLLNTVLIDFKKEKDCFLDLRKTYCDFQSLVTISWYTIVYCPTYKQHTQHTHFS